MWKVAALFGLIGSAALGHQIEDACSVENVYEQVIISTLAQIGTPETAVFPELPDVTVTQEGSECRFTFEFHLQTTNVNGDLVNESVTVIGFRIWNRTWQKLGRINVELTRP
jgi:hypothetical protein